MSEIDDKTQESVSAIRGRTDAVPGLGIILGSGLGSLAGRISNAANIPYKDIPNFPVPTVEGHEGNLVIGELKGVSVAVMQGRFHFYEGYYMREVTFPVRVLARLGVETLIVTNAAGGISDGLEPGDFMALTDHINLMGTNPLLGIEPEDEGRERFLDLTETYDQGLRLLARETAHEADLDLDEGVLAAMAGPCYETPAEIRMLKAIGADAVCMSTVPEVIMARYLGMKVLGFSLITNKAAGLAHAGLSHAEVIDMAGKRHNDFVTLIEGVVEKAGKAGIL